MLNKYIFSILLKDETLFEREVERLYNIINTTTDLTVLRILREIFGKKGQTDRETQILEKILKLNPKDANVLNNYAYYLSLRGDKLERAEAMSKASNELEPGQSSYEDTYGWIMFKVGKYSDAKIWIEKALNSGGDKSATVLEHYGDVLYKLGDTNKAMEFWQKAKAAGDGASELLDKKIQDKIFIE